MKNLRALLLLIIPALMVACNDGNQNRNNNKNNNRNHQNRENDMNRSRSGRDTVSRGSFLINFNRADQEDDQKFVKEVASSSLMEIELGRLARENARNPRVKKFGDMMVRDHTKASDELKSIASAKNIDVPSEMDDKHQKMVEEVREKNGDDFDKAYIKTMSAAHEKDIDLFRKQSEDGTDASLKTFATKTLPILIMHNDSVKAIQKDLK